MTVRNIRNHQSRGLLPPPDVRGRIGYYGDTHVTRLRLIQELQAEGFKLDTIKRLIGSSTGVDPERFMGLRRLVTAPFETESPEILDADELIERFGPVDMKALAKAQRLGLLVPIGDGRFEAPSPAIVRAAEEVISLGIPLSAALSAIERAQRNLKSIAHTFVQLFLDELWIPFDKADQPDERWAEITDAIERLRPLVSEVVLAAFKQTMSAEVEKAFGKVLERQAKRAG